VECQAALEAAEEGAQDTAPSRPGALDVLAQHVLGMACSQPFDSEQLYREVTSASPYQGLTREGFDKIVRFVSTGGYALANYERYAKLKQMPDGRYRIAHPRLAQQYRLNVGTIVEAPMVRVRLARRQGGALKPSAVLAAGRVLGEVEEYFIEKLVPGDSFVFAGEVLRFEGLRETDAIVTRSHAPEPKVPSYDGGKFPLSTYLADRVRRLLADRTRWARLPDQVSDWLRIQSEVSVVPGPDEILVETFPRGQRHYLVCYPFEGRLAHQSLGMLLTRRLERGYAKPLGFVANEYALCVWGLSDMGVRRPASGEGRGLRGAGHDDPPLRHAEHAPAPCRLPRPFCTAPGGCARRQLSPQRARRPAQSRRSRGIGGAAARPRLVLDPRQSRP